MTPDAPSLGKIILARLADAARHSEDGPGVTRQFATPEHGAAAKLIMSWMRDAGMTVHMDDIGNVVGRYEGTEGGQPTLMFGSHQDTVRCGGAYDGMLGVALPIACVEALHKAGQRFPFAIEVVAFGDEEGLRFKTSLLGSHALAGTFDMSVLSKTDANGITMDQALRDFGLNPDNIPSLARKAEDMLAFVEVHIEQGPVLESEGLPVGVVTSIACYKSLTVTITGEAGHAGTVPMTLRRDSLMAAAECLLAVETACKGRAATVGTAGMISASPGAINVIPGTASFSLDIRSQDRETLEAALADINARFDEIASNRNVSLDMTPEYMGGGCALDPSIIQELEQAVENSGIRPFRLPSGAAHDAMAMADLTKTGMLFVRCTGGISHRPDEAITATDADIAAQAILAFIRGL